MPGPLRIDYRRILFVVQPHLFSGQYANRRFRGTDHHLVSLVDRARRSLLQGKYAYIISLDAAGAFDNVARRRWRGSKLAPAHPRVATGSLFHLQASLENRDGLRPARPYYVWTSPRWSALVDPLAFMLQRSA